jgi:hypothetical protein
MALMIRSCWFVLVGTLAFVLALPAYAADAPPDPKKAEAAQRFDRGLQLFDDGDTAGALAEFKRTYELVPNPVVLFNIGLVYAAMGRPVSAVDALEKVMQTPDKISADQRERATRTLNDQRQRIGRLMVTTTPEGARIDIDNVESSRTPLTGPIRISEGAHIIGAVAEGYAPDRKEVVVAGNSEATVHFDLVSTQGKQLANLTVRSRIAGAEVIIDNKPAGKTPLATSITLLAGHHAVELRRPGYRPSRQEVDVGAGATGELSFDLAVDPAQLSAEGAMLAIDASEPHPVLFVDDEHKGPYTEPVRLPRGPHRLRVESAGFLPVERNVNLDQGQTSLVHVDFVPTPEKRAAYVSSARFHRTWGIIGLVGGVIIGGGGTAWLVANKSNKDDTRAEYEHALVVLDSSQYNDGRAIRPCAILGPPASEPGGQTNSQEECDAFVASARQKFDSAKSKDVIGFVGIGVGAAVAVTGLVLLLTGDDPGRYDKPPSNKLSRRPPPGPRFMVGPGPGHFGGSLGVVF